MTDFSVELTARAAMHYTALMRAMRLNAARERLERIDLPQPEPGPDDVLIKVAACGICRTDLHIVDGELTSPKLPLVPGHQIVGTVEERGERVDTVDVGARVGVPWLGWTCGACAYCRRGEENLCDQARFTGYTIDGGYAEYALANARYCFPIPDGFEDLAAAPLLCAGLIGYRALRMAGDAERIGFLGFGAAAHILIQIARYQGRRVAAFTKAGDTEGQQFAARLGAVWAGDVSQPPPEELDAAIIFAPAGELVPASLRLVRKGGTVICAGIHMSDIPAFPYHILWGERTIRSVANLTRRDGEEFLEIAPRVPVRTEVTVYELERADDALDALRSGKLHGAGVLTMSRAVETDGWK